MAHFFTMPQLGSTMEEGLIVRWHKQEGDQVRKGDVLLEIETDKATMEVECLHDGIVHKILANIDVSVPIQQPIAIIGDEDDEIAHLLAEFGLTAEPAADLNELSDAADGGPENATHHIEHTAAMAVSPRARRLAEVENIPLKALAGSGTGPEGRVIERDVLAYIEGRETPGSKIAAAQPVDIPVVERTPRITPLAARVADDLGIDIQDLALGLPGSRVRREDVMRHANAVQPVQSGEMQPAAAVSSEAGKDYVSSPYSGLRKRIGDNVARSAFTAPHVTLTLEVDMSRCAELRGNLLPGVEKWYGVRLSYTDILVKAAARALDQHPRLNSVLAEDEIRTYAVKNIGVAVALDEGLVAPVVKRVESKTLGAISAELKQLIERARAGKFTPEDVSGGTFTLTNLGAFGIDVFDPIIVPGQAAILGVGRIADKPVVIDGEVKVRAMMNLCLSFDHRIVDGAPAARFLQRLKELLENPLTILV